MDSRKIQIAMADSVINGVYCLNITQNITSSLDNYGATLNKLL